MTSWDTWEKIFWLTRASNCSCTVHSVETRSELAIFHYSQTNLLRFGHDRFNYCRCVLLTIMIFRFIHCPLLIFCYNKSLLLIKILFVNKELFSVVGGT